MFQENTGIISCLRPMMHVIDLPACYLRMTDQNYLYNFSGIDYEGFLLGILGKSSDNDYELYEFHTTIPTKIDTTDIRGVFEDFLSWELNISPNQKDGSPTKILLKI